MDPPPVAGGVKGEKLPHPQHIRLHGLAAQSALARDDELLEEFRGPERLPNSHCV
jgi:hypothetical protein